MDKTTQHATITDLFGVFSQDKCGYVTVCSVTSVSFANAFVQETTVVFSPKVVKTGAGDITDQGLVTLISF